MILLIDVGNTRTKWAGLESGLVSFNGVAPHMNQSVEQWVLHNWCSMEAPKRVVVSCVLDSGFKSRLTDVVNKLWGIDVEYVSVQKNALDIEVAYADPGMFGVDRWLAMIAAFNLVKSSVCVVDCGSAITIDLLTCKGKHVGGVVVPGLSMMRTTLVEKTGRVLLAETDLQEGKLELANNTHAGVMNGTLYCAVSFIDRVVKDLIDSTESPVSVIITGGDAQQISELLSIKNQHDANLVLKGLSIFVQQG
ncbi:MAG: type III pantothenate kinase [Gammaproteobacteria bacterium]